MKNNASFEIKSYILFRAKIEIIKFLETVAL